MNSITDYIAAIEARRRSVTDLANDHADLQLLLKLVRKYREALERHGGRELESYCSECRDALTFDPRKGLQNPAQAPR